jgi:hypothetical protein
VDEGCYFAILFMRVVYQSLNLLCIELTDLVVRVLVSRILSPVTAWYGRHMDPVLLLAIVYLLELVWTDFDGRGQMAVVRTVFRENMFVLFSLVEQ